MRVLVVEDDRLTRSVLCDLLARRGHEAVPFGEAEPAWEASQQEVFPLMLLDWVLPGMDGLELCRRIRTLSGGDRSVILVITARDRPEHLAAALEAGANDYLPKPFDVASLEVRLTIAEREMAGIAARQQAEEALAYQALHDSLTSLPNRSLLYDRLQLAILAAQRANKALALLVMDLDHFKEVNDALGHQHGDLLLREVGQRLQASLRASDTVARLGGDEFAVLLPGANVVGARLAAAKLLHTLQQPCAVNGHVLEVGASAGIAVCPQHGEDAETLLRKADVAMYAAKRERGGYQVYAAEQDQHTLDRLELMGELRQAIEDGQLVLQYQPKVHLQGTRMVYVEALVRWQHPRHGLLQPEQFIPLAEQTGLIVPLTQWVLDEALRQCRTWRQAGLEVRMAVNLSARNLHDLELPETIGGLLASYGVPAGWLRLELTESAVVANHGRAREIFAQVQDMGVQVAIDDFGAGYTSLGYLKRLPVNQIKIDRSFVREMVTNSSDVAIVRATIDLSHDLGLEVVAEGVEDRATWELLADLGCDIAQGYYLARPMDPEELARWLGESPWGLQLR